MAEERKYAIHYVEFPATDLERTKAFYSQAFGWTFTDYGEEYISFEEDSPIGGGFYLTQEVPPSSPLVVLHADDLEVALASVKEAGGQIVRDIFSFPGGRRFHFTDPSGNELAVSSDY